MKKEIKKNNILMLMFGIYTGAIIIQNILATKQIDITIFTVTTGILVSPLVFIIQDIVAEIYGYKDAKNGVVRIYYEFYWSFIIYISNKIT